MLCILNTDVDRLNDVVLERYLPGDAFLADAAHERVADVSGYEDGMGRHFSTQEYMKSVSYRGVPSATLRLKKGCLLILTRNMLASLGLVNGTKLILLSEPPAAGDFLRVLHVKTVPHGDEAPQFFAIPRISFDLTTPGGLPFVRRQFPVRLAYVMTSNKAQGQTLNKSCGNTTHAVRKNSAHRTANAPTIVHVQRHPHNFAPPPIFLAELCSRAVLRYQQQGQILRHSRLFPRTCAAGRGALLCQRRFPARLGRPHFGRAASGGGQVQARAPAAGRRAHCG
jgi:hypothetical protein